MKNNDQKPAIAIIPYRCWSKFNLNKLSLDLLDWPLGRPDRLQFGTIRDLRKDDHLIAFPQKPVFLFPRLKIKAKISIMIVEPNSIHKLYITLTKFLYWRFYKVLTKDKYLLKYIHNCSFFYFGSTILKNHQKIDITKKSMASLIASTQNQLIGHKLRHEIARNIKNNQLDVAVIGAGYKPFENKEDGLKSYRYSIVIENSSELDYFTEKLIDTCLLETVPIYWGAPNISEYFDTRGFIICKDLDELLQAIDQMSLIDYNSKIKWIKKNKVKALYHAEYIKRAATIIHNSLKN